MSIMSKMFGKKNKSTDIIPVTEEIIEPMQTQEGFESPQQDNSNLDVNIVISCFQEKLSQVMTELIVKEATIKQLLTQIEKIKGR